MGHCLVNRKRCELRSDGRDPCKSKISGIVSRGAKCAHHDGLPGQKNGLGLARHSTQ